ncbi:hypothetical protein [Microbacterium hominis]|uniref:Uncharacterized protein n=1 Tax=Microbacterium hominis TaxID=162426 RepID=A0A7D4U8Z7_9MICO|nr:hypothetical protein [Microbacterium hominis]QKJ20366.1 hypothetical protein HQM25_14015 [Microbacterium hominis]
MSGPALAYRLPGEWWSVPMTTADDASASIAALVRQTLGRRDDQATARARQRARLTDAAERARAAGATQFHLSLRDGAGIALASTLAEYRPLLPLGGQVDAAAVADALVGAFAREATGDASIDDPWERFAAAGGAVFAKDDGLVLRRTRSVAGDDPGDAHAQVPTVIVDYWLTVPGRAAVVLSTFATGLAELEPLMVDLFDAVVAASAWIEDPAEGGLRAELRRAR